MGKKNDYLDRIKQRIEIEKSKTRDHMMQHTVDMCTIALGRLGWREKRLQRFIDEYNKAVDDYYNLTREDLKDGDKDIVYTIESMERELKKYCGTKYAPRSLRYAIYESEKNK